MMDKLKVEYLYDEILLSYEKEWSTCHNTEKPSKRYARRKKPYMKCHILHDSVYEKCPESNEVAARDWDGLLTAMGFLVGSWKCPGVSLDGCAKLWILENCWIGLFLNANFMLCECFLKKQENFS